MYLKIVNLEKLKIIFERSIYFFSGLTVCISMKSIHKHLLYMRFTDILINKKSEIWRRFQENCVPAIRNRSPETCWVRLSSQKNPTAATMLPHSITAAAMPKNPAVMRRRSKNPEKDTLVSMTTAHLVNNISHHTATGNTSSSRTFPKLCWITAWRLF